MIKLKAKGPWWDFHDVLVGKPEAFQTSGALRGDGGCVSLGQLPDEWAESAIGASYTVYSYDTPIAWLDSEGVWQCPDVKYSVTTSAHQGKIRTALSQINAG